jgi:hypothetical protein
MEPSYPAPPEGPDGPLADGQLAAYFQALSAFRRTLSAMQENRVRDG